MRYVRYCTEDGMLMFNVLSIGNRGKHVFRGMNPEMLVSLRWNKYVP